MKKENISTTTPGRLLVARYDSKISRTTTALKNACEIVNRAIPRLKNSGALPDGVNLDTITAIITDNTTPFVANLERSIHGETANSVAMGNLAPFAIDSGKEQIARILADVANEMRRKFITSADIPEILANVEVENGVATYSPEHITEYYSEYATNAQSEFLKEARRVFDILADFDRKTRIYSRGKIHGIGESGVGEIISIYGDRIVFDAAAVVNLDNLEANTDNAAMTINNTLIQKPER